ncbi:AraC family transcriptional regulator [Parathalassolituus penaei]|uniref:Helix-turn-helix transcriptional regulator n=1 Tax=Parathalassolituus penaei TaxID=2997323 RepID=A0A9X3EB47_9GAMM|nr:helix-turn-helix transcriptional regulator [Parathalassolituus penaei]MCY0963990.1 helix-turn-helix transcriptional regulator [Parathalassolituus penaei]
MQSYASAHTPFINRNVGSTSTDRGDIDPQQFLRGFFGHDNMTDNLQTRRLHSQAMNIECHALGDLSIARILFRQSASMTSRSSADACYLQLVVSGHCLTNVEQQLQELSSGDSLMLNPGSQRYSSYPAGCELVVVRIPRSSLLQAAIEFGFSRTRQEIRFCSEPLSREQAGSLFHLLQAIMVQLPQSIAGNAGDYYDRLLSLAILRAFPTNIPVSQSNNSLGRPSAHPHIETIRSHVLRRITDDFDIEQLAGLCHVSTKTLYNIFNRELGITPANYIRGIKLEAVHQELSNAKDIRNVTEVAIRYGFTNLSRFSNQYREMFGELPSATLKNARRIGSRA